MPTLSFRVNADFREAVRLRQEMDRLENAMRNFRPGAAISSLSELEGKLRTARSRYAELTNEAARAGAQLELSMRNGVNGAMSALNSLQGKLSQPLIGTADILGVAGVGLFLERVKNIRAQFQEMETSINVLVGQKKGEKLMGELTQFAKVSPLDFKGTVAGAKMMLGFGIEAEKVPRYLSAIGDAAMGNAQRFNSLTLAFSQMSAAGKLMGQDLNQMINAGFNPLQAMSEKTGKSITALKKEMSDGKISAAMVQQAFVDATSEGGKFYQMSEKSAQTLGGQMSMLTDATDLMLNDLGKHSEGAIMKVIRGATWIVEHWQTVGRVFMAVAATVGIYKASAMAADFAERKSAEERANAIVEGYERQRLAMEEYQRSKGASAAGEVAEVPSEVLAKVERGQAITEAEAAQVEAYTRRLEVLQALREEEQAYLEATGQVPAAPDLADYDADLRAGMEKGMVTQEEADGMMRLRSEMDAFVAGREEAVRLANQELDDADDMFAICSQQVRDAEDRNAKARENLSLLEEMRDLEEDMANGWQSEGDDERLDAIRGQLAGLTELEIEQEAEAAAEHLSTMENDLNSASRARNEAETRAQRLQREANAASQTRDTAATVGNTAALAGNTGAQAASTRAGVLRNAMAKAAVLWHNLESAAIRAKTNAVRALNAAWAANPIGLIITGVTMAVSAIMSFIGASEQAAAETRRFSDETERNVNNVDLLYNVLAAADKDSKVYKDSLEELTKVAKDYGFTIDDEKDRLLQLNSIRAQLIELIKEEGRQRMIAADLESFQEEKKRTSDRLKDKVRIKGEHSELYEDSAKNLIAIDVERNAERIAEIYDEIWRINKKRGTRTKSERRDELYAEMEELAYGSYNRLREQYGDGKAHGNWMAIGEAAREYARATRNIEDYTRAVQESKEKTEELTPEKPAYTTEGKDSPTLAKDLKEANEQLVKLDAAQTKVKADSSQVEEVKDKAGEAKEGMENLDSGTAEPKVRTNWLERTLELLDGIIGSWESLQSMFSKGLEMGGEFLENIGLIPKGSAPTEKNRQAKERTEAEEKRDKARAALSDMTTLKKESDFKARTDAISEVMKDLEVGSKDWKYWNGLREKVNKKLAALKGNPNHDPLEQAYQLKQAEQAESKRLAKAGRESAYLAEENRIGELELADPPAAEKARIALDERKRRDAREEKLQDEIERIKKHELQQWMKSGDKSKASRWLQSKTDAEYEEMARRNIGFDTLSEADERQLAAKRRELAEESADALRKMNMDYGTFYQSRLAMAQDYEKRITKARTEGEKQRLKEELRQRTVEADKEALESMLAQYGDYEARRTAIMQQYERKRRGKSAAEAAALSLEETAKLRELEDDTNASFRQHGVNASLFGYLDTLNLDVLDELREKLMNLLGDVSATPETLERAARHLDDVRNAISKRERAARESNPLGNVWGLNGIRSEREDWQERLQREAETKRTLAGTLTGISDRSKAEERSAASRLRGMLADKGVTEEFTTDNLSGFASLFSGQEAEAFQEAQSNWLAKLAESGDAARKAGEAQEEAAAAQEAEQGATEGGDAIGFAIADAIIHGVNQNIQSLDGFMDDLGLGETQFGKGMKDFAESSQYATQAFDSLKQGDLIGVAANLNKAFGSLGNVLGRLGIGGMGASDLTLHDDMERLSNVNAELVRATRNLADKMQEATSVESARLYREQLEQTRLSESNTRELMARAGAAHNKGFAGIGGKHSSDYNIDREMGETEWRRVSELVGHSVSSAAQFWSLTSEQMARVADEAPDIYAHIKQLGAQGLEDAAQYMDDYIGYYRQFEELQDAFREKMTSFSMDSVRSEFRSQLMDMESAAEDFADNFEEMMRQAVISSMVSDLYDSGLKEWYRRFSDSMEGGLTKSEQEELRRQWDEMAARAIEARKAMAEEMGWEQSATQRATTRTLASMSQDTGDAIEGRLTAVQIAVEAMRSASTERNLSLATVTDSVLAMMAQGERATVFYGNLESQAARMHNELQSISDHTSRMVGPIARMSEDISDIRRMTKNL